MTDEDLNSQVIEVPAPSPISVDLDPERSDVPKIYIKLSHCIMPPVLTSKQHYQK